MVAVCQLFIIWLGGCRHKATECQSAWKIRFGITK